MKTVEILGKQMQIYSVSALSVGYGRKRISVEIIYNGNSNTFTASTTDMEAFDEANEIDNYDERQYAIFSIVKYQIIEQIANWLII